MRRLFVLMLVVSGVAGCSTGATLSYHDGYNAARQIVHGVTLRAGNGQPKGPFLAGSPAKECALLAARMVPSGDEEQRWEAGCQAAFAKLTVASSDTFPR